MYGFSHWRPRVSTMEDFRREISERPEEFLQLIAETEKATGIPVTAELYKRPKPTDNPALEPYFAWKGNIDCIRQEPVTEDLFGPELGDRVLDLFQKLIPLYDYFTKFTV